MPSDSAASRLKAFPVAFVTTGKRLLLLGGCGGPLCRLAHALQFDWGSIHVIPAGAEPPCCRECRSDSRVRLSEREPRESDVIDADIVIESTTDQGLAGRLSGWCRAHRVPLNSMDKLEQCDLYYMSLLRRGPLLLAISSGGDSPAISAALRRKLDREVGPGWTHAAELLADLRRRLAAGPGRTELLKSLANDETFLACVEKDDVEGLKRLIDHAVARMSD